MKRKIPDDVRRLVYERDNEACQEPNCGLSRHNGDVVNLHHIKPEQFGGTETPDNLITLCDIHHKAMHVEFHAFYPDSQGVLRKMMYLTNRAHSRIKRFLKVDDGNDLSPYLEYLTGHRKFRPGQLKAVRAALNNQDVLFVTPTGSGKSVCYQLPGFIADNPSLVISPLKALMKDQVESIWKKKFPTTYVNSDLSDGEKQQRFRFISQRLYKFLFVAPERFFKSTDPSNQTLYQKYSYLVVDEAHEIHLWGNAFRSSYAKIGTLRKDLGDPVVIALTASASKETQEIIVESLGMVKPEVIVTGFYRNNIKIIKHIAGLATNTGITQSKTEYIKKVIYAAPGNKILIFVPTKKIGNELLEALKKEKYDVEFYYGDLDPKLKMSIQDRFTGMSEPGLEILISTSAFGMGIDIPDIRHIIHYSPALSVEDYYQQIGRAGRDGEQSYAHLLYQESDDSILRFMATISTKNTGFKSEHNYTDTDVSRVVSGMEERLDKMLKIIDLETGQEWPYILEYFGQKTPTFWDEYGVKIVEVIIKIADTGTVIGLILLAIIIIKRIT